MKYRVSAWRITWRFLIIYLVILVVAFLAAFSLFFSFTEEGKVIVNEWGISQTLFVIIFAVVFVVTYVPSLRCFYFIVEDKSFILKRIGKDYEYEYANIEFIDIEESERKGMVIFYSSKARMRYMLGDKNGEVLKILIKKCPNIMSVEEFRRRHPEERY